MTSRIVLSMALLLLAACETKVAVITYPCKHPDPTHVGPDRKLDPCHFEDPDSPARAVATFFEAAGPAFCDAFFACCTNTKLVQTLGGATVDDCKVGWSRGQGLGDRTLVSLKAALVDGESVFNQARLDACVARLQAMAAGGAACVEPAAFVLLNSCMGAFEGQIAPGDACTWGESNMEDVSFTACKDGRCFDGKCVPFLKTGDSCIVDTHLTDPPDTMCNYVQGEACMGVQLPFACGPQVEIGSACFGGYNTFQCKSLTCDDSNSKSWCLPPIPDDTACDVY